MKMPKQTRAKGFFIEHLILSVRFIEYSTASGPASLLQADGTT
jgi:hypothetical protein